MGSALLSRFDLVFIILDKPDEDLDSLLSEHVMTLHCGKKRTFSTSVLREVSEESSCNHYLWLYTGRERLIRTRLIRSST